jgi:flagellar basal-body rod protein FlgG
MRSLTTAASGMQAQQLNVEVISNNLANMNTTGFKRQRAEFQDLLYQNVQQMGVNSSDTGTIVPTGAQVGLGVDTGSIYRITEQGGLAATDNPYDLAIAGNGFFQVQLPSGETGYTRAGAFALSPTGQSVTSEGYPVSPGVTIPQGLRANIEITDEGQVQATVDGSTTPTVVGQLELATFFNEAGLEAVGGNMYLETAASGAATTGTGGSPGFGDVRQGFVETSNVNAVTEITALIAAQRAYEMNARVITASDEMLAASSNLR